MVPDTIDDRRSKGPARKDYRIMYENGYKRLQDSLMDVIAEEQAKLGYMKEPIRLYYPLSSLNHFFESENDAEAMQESLEGFPKATKEIFGEVQVSHKGDRFCFFLSENATEYVHKHRDENAFIFALVQLLTKHGTTLDEVKELFRSQTSECAMKPMDNGEFDLMIRFVDSEDPYYYCFKDEGCHIIYHRFLPEDYADFGF